jgi:histidinol-phosphatase (PHP family)
MSYGDIMKKSDIYLNGPISKGKEQGLEDIVNQAVKKDIQVLSILDCIEKTDGVLRTTSSCRDALKHRAEIMELQRMRNEITLLNGIQVSQPYERGEEFEFYASFPMDMIVGIVDDFDKGLQKEEEIKKAYDDYYCKNLYAVESGKIDVLSHLGLIHTYYGYRYCNDSLIDTLLREMIHRNVLLEITSGVQRKDNFSTFPSYDLLKRYKKLGGEMVTIGTHANDIQNIGKNLEETYQIAHDLELNPGYFQKRKFKKIL